MTSTTGRRPAPRRGSASKTGRHVTKQHEHRDVSGGWLRPTVFGAMDGLVTNVSLIAGVGGGGLNRQHIILTGLAGLVAGAFSMATGEYTSVTSQNELVLAEVDVERRQLERYPDEEQAELTQAFVDKGVDRDLATKVAEQVSRDQHEALRLHAQEELGVDPHELPSPWVAAISSFFSCALGALVPLLPYLLGSSSLWLALVIAGVSLLIAGAVVARLTEQPLWYGAVRQLLLATLAAGVTYLVGRGIGASVG